MHVKRSCAEPGMGKNPPGKPGKNRNFSGNNMKSFEDP